MKRGNWCIRKKIRFEAAHVLTNAYSVECKQIHGHSYQLEVFFRSELLNNNSMVYDFKAIKEVVQPLINVWDHSLIIQADTPAHRALKEEGNLITVPFNPTAEEMAKFFYDYIKAQVSSLYKVRVYETETGYAEYWEE